jgi:hypothetical protein
MVDKKETKEEKLDVKEYTSASKVPILKKETMGDIIIMGKLISRLNFPMVIPYGKESLVIPPKGNASVNKTLLGELPKGILFLKN